MADGHGMALQRGGVRLLVLSPACTGLGWCRLMKPLFQSWSRKLMSQPSQSTPEATPGMITHYGLFWSERDVFWGTTDETEKSKARAEEDRPSKQKGPGKPPGKMHGSEKRGATKENEIECYRDYVGLYCLYGNNELLYIGEAGLGTESTIYVRLKQHRKDPMADRWDRFSWFGCERESLRGQTDIENAFRQLEAVTIAIINPGFNKQSGTFKGAKQVFQVPHDKSEGSLETKIFRIAKQIKELKNRA